MTLDTNTGSPLIAAQVSQIPVQTLEAASVVLAAGPRIFDTSPYCGHVSRWPASSGRFEAVWVVSGGLTQQAGESLMGAMRKALVYLGLAEEDERKDTYDDFDEPSAHHEISTRDERSAAVTNLHHQTPVARVVRDVEVGALTRIATIHPRTYNEAKNIGEHFRDGTPVIMNLTDLDDADAKHLVDFGAGLVFGLHGSIERVTNKVFLLSPVHVEVTASEVEATRLAPAASSTKS